MGGVGGFYFNSKGLNNKVYDPNSPLNDGGFSNVADNQWYKLRELRTEGQGLEGNPTKWKDGKTYSPIQICFPVGFGLEKGF